jgi:DNA-binding winged helix-turn-helix (wHTH) protein
MRVRSKLTEIRLRSIKDLSGSERTIPMAGQALGFATFCMDLERLRLDGTSGPIDLRPKSFDVLRYLLEHHGHVVSKDELITAVWPNVSVSDEALTQCMTEVRRALADDRKRIIKTIPRRGYLVDVPVSAIDRLPTPASQATTPESNVATLRSTKDVAPRSHQSGWLAKQAVLLSIAIIGALASMVIFREVMSGSVPSFDGMWHGELHCDKLPVAAGALAAPIEVTVAGLSARYSRKVLSPDGTSIVGTEEGIGTVTRDGILRLVGIWTASGDLPPYSYSASYLGRASGEAAELRGTQEWKLEKSAYLTRNCSVSLKRWTPGVARL